MEMVNDLRPRLWVNEFGLTAFFAAHFKCRSVHVGFHSVHGV